MTGTPARAPRTLGDRYELLSLIAGGGMGQVWRARDTLLSRSVAVKVLRSEFTGDSTFLARFRAEAQHSAALVHRNIATLYDYGEEPAPDGSGETVAYLVMELVEGESLSEMLAREGRLSAPRTLEVLRQTAAALAVAHDAGVVHRDVKPANVLVGSDGVVKITDFGIAWSAASVPLTRTGQVVGTPHYLSPEQAAGNRATPASDVYALGMIGYECLAGRRAFDGENAVQIALRQLRDEPDPLPADVPDDVRMLVDRALVKDPAQRLTDGAAVRDVVDDVLAGRPVSPPPAGPPTLTWASAAPSPASRRRRALVPLVALLAGAGIAVAAVSGLAGAPPAPVAAEDADAPLVLVAGDYVGRPADEVEAELGGLGLRVERVSAETTAADPGLVTALGPTGAVAAGELISVTVAVAPVAVPEPAPPAPPAAPAAPASPVASVPDAVAEVPAGTGRNGDWTGDEGDDADDDDGNGNGNGNGKAWGKGNGNGKGNGGRGNDD